MRATAESSSSTDLRDAIARFARNPAIRVAVAAVLAGAGFFAVAGTGFSELLRSAAIAAAAAVAAALLWPLARSYRTLHADIRHLEERIETLADRNWELREADERAKHFLEAQG